MTICKPPRNDEFDRLIQQTLTAQVARQSPRRTVWWRIRMLMSASWVHEVRHWRWSLVVQLAVVLLIVFGGRTQFRLRQVPFDTPAPIFTPTVWSPLVAVASVAVVVQPETQEMRLLKIAPRRTPRMEVVSTPPLNLPPTDVVRPSAPGYSPPVPATLPEELLALIFPFPVEGGELQ